MRPLLVLLHRWLGLFMAVFLFISGLTGALISWDHELDAWLNPALYEAEWQSEAYDALESARHFEAANPDLMVTWLPLSLEENEALNLFVAARSEEFDEKLDYNQLALHPQTHEVQAKRMWGEISLDRENLLPFLYKLHYSMHLPDIGGIEAGILFMGIVGIVWFLDCFIALAISFPSKRNWRKSFRFRWSKGKHKLNFDLHRSGGVWLWLLLLVLAFTSISMNLEHQVVRPLVNAVSPLSADPFETNPFQPYSKPDLVRADILKLAEQEALRQGIDQPPGGIFYARDFNLYGVGYFEPGNSHGDGGLGNPWLYFSGKTGELAGKVIPGEGSFGDIFLQAQFPLHSGRIIGVPGRILLSFLGLAVAALSVTGIVIWARKRRSVLLRKSSKSQVVLSETSASDVLG